ncbi:MULTISPECIES: hypothetical protein [Pseudofrankia]|uniref:hypothetical protein n=1 Tax=Pseudofrankia TaxID=2994363 RepID=UPI000234CA2C|nr:MULTISPECIES: hypothetical protein [Pseudofrankia]
MIAEVFASVLAAAFIVGATLWLAGRRYRLEPAARAGRRALLTAGVGAMAFFAIRWAVGQSPGDGAEASGGPTAESSPDVDATAATTPSTTSTPQASESAATEVSTSARGAGYWLVTAGGAVMSCGAAPHLGSSADSGAEIVALVPTATAEGYWLVTRGGELLPFGDALRLSGPVARRPVIAAGIVGLAEDDDRPPGMWLLTDDGDVLGRGSAPVFGTLAAVRHTGPAAGIVSTMSGRGYWIADTQGSAHAFGDATQYETVTGRLNEDVTGIAAVDSRSGYWLVAGDGGVFSYPTNTTDPAAVKFYGSLGEHPPVAKVVGLAPTAFGDGYWLADETGAVYPFGAAPRIAADTPTGLTDVVGIVTFG